MLFVVAERCLASLCVSLRFFFKKRLNRTDNPLLFAREGTGTARRPADAFCLWGMHHREASASVACLHAAIWREATSLAGNCRMSDPGTQRRHSGGCPEAASCIQWPGMRVSVAPRVYTECV